MIFCVLAVLVYLLIAWPLSSTFAGVLLAAPPAVLRVGLGPLYREQVVRGVTLRWGRLPLGLWLDWGGNNAGRALGAILHLTAAIAGIAVSGLLGSEIYDGLHAFCGAVLLWEDTGVGGLVGGWRAAAPVANARPLESVVAAVTEAATFGLVLSKFLGMAHAHWSGRLWLAALLLSIAGSLLQLDLAALR